jgi:hypothetical protein
MWWIVALAWLQLLGALMLTIGATFVALPRAVGLATSWLFTLASLFLVIATGMMTASLRREKQQAAKQGINLLF